ncbi:MAG: helix-turn-helix domain-containing protein [Solirubrobacteraceae bacterium]|nr:helix-turn-helix domain-containing protein [Solirubrobacteraceae bacterium]
MSVEALSWVFRRSRAEHSARLVLLSLANHAGGDGGHTYPSIGKIAAETRLGESTVRGALEQLKDLGEITEVGVSPLRTRCFRLPLDPAESAGSEGADTAGSGGAESAPPQNLHPRRIQQPTPQILRFDPAESAPKPSLTVHQPKEDASHPRPVRPNRTTTGDVTKVFDEWVTATGRTGRTQLTDKRRRIIRRALASHGLADCLDAVHGWRHSSHHRGENQQQTVYDDLELLLRDARQIEKFRDLQRKHGVGGNVAGAAAASCPGFSSELAARWAPLAARLADLVEKETHDVWLRPLHPHTDLDGTLVLGLPPEIALWVGDRFRGALDRAAADVGEQPVRLIECASNALGEVNAA